MAKAASLPSRLFRFLFRLLLLFGLLSLALVGLLRFVPPPVTLTMLFDANGITKEWTPLDRINASMVRAVIAAEDAKFCSHNGFDEQAIAQAWVSNLSGGRIRGGSTVSQQTAKNVFLWQGGGYFRKGLEAWFTFLIESLWGKRRIMEVYLNVAETGIGTYGVEAGAIRYFGKHAEALTATESARIAAALPLPKARAVKSPRGFVRRYGNAIAARARIVARDGLDACIG